MSEIKAGYTVQLKSGGPDMTVSFVENISSTEEAACYWFDDKRKRQSGRFPTTSLKIISK
jgi:uncharacterized protein YodC (DUF2158 family)